MNNFPSIQEVIKAAEESWKKHTEGINVTNNDKAHFMCGWLQSAYDQLYKAHIKTLAMCEMN